MLGRLMLHDKVRLPPFSLATILAWWNYKQTFVSKVLVLGFGAVFQNLLSVNAAACHRHDDI